MPSLRSFAFRGPGACAVIALATHLTTTAARADGRHDTDFGAELRLLSPVPADDVQRDAATPEHEAEGDEPPPVMMLEPAEDAGDASAMVAPDAAGVEVVESDDVPHTSLYPERHASGDVDAAPLGAHEKEAQARGTHVLAELYGGASLATGVGFAGSALVGWGGKVPGMPLRLYLVAQLAYATSSSAGTLERLPVMYVDRRDYFDMGAGLRIYLPIFGPLRVFGDALLGPSYTAGALDRDDAPSLTASGWTMTGTLGAGVQFRIIDALSIGARIAMRITGDPLEGFRVHLGLDEVNPVTATLGMTWHT